MAGIERKDLLLRLENLSPGQRRTYDQILLEEQLEAAKKRQNVPLERRFEIIEGLLDGMIPLIEKGKMERPLSPGQFYGVDLTKMARDFEKYGEPNKGSEPKDKP